MFSLLDAYCILKGKKRMGKKKKLSLKKVVIVLTSMYVAYILISTQVTMLKLKKEMDIKQQELAKQSEKNRKLQDEVERMTNNPDEYSEKLARERLGLIKPNETLVIPKK
jgi:cell division protein FtsB